MNNRSNDRVITFGAMWKLFCRRFWIILIAAAVSVALAFAVITLTYEPKYESTATMYVLRQDSEGQVSGADSDFSLALKVVNDCTYLLKSHAVVDKVIETLELDVEYEDLCEKISTNNPEDTRILEVIVEADSAEEAKKIADSLCTIGQEKIATAMGFQQVNFYEQGTLSDEPSNEVGPMTYLVIGFAAAVLTYAVYLVITVLDDRIRTEDDVQQVLGISLLADIPNAAETGKRRAYGVYGQQNSHKTENRPDHT